MKSIILSSQWFDLSITFFSDYENSMTIWHSDHPLKDFFVPKSMKQYFPLGAIEPKEQNLVTQIY
jgi:mRNA-degrading endonuclease HigB of HigAB toxin-antitoxin module